MMIRAANNGGTVVPLDFTERKRRLPQSTWIAIGLVGAAHVVVGVALYNQQFELKTLTEAPTMPPPIIVTLDMPKPPEPKPLLPTQQPAAPAPLTHIPHVVAPWVTETVTATPTTSTTPSPGPVIDLTPAPNPAPTGTATETALPAPAGPPVITAPHWISQPTGQQLMQAYPDRALRLA